MSDAPTPRTDALTKYLVGKSADIREEEQKENGKQLERELAAAEQSRREDIRRCRDMAKAYPFSPAIGAAIAREIEADFPQDFPKES